jgi:hypothetical protein
MPTTQKLLTAAAGSAGGGALYVEDVFSTYLYTGNATARSFINGVDLSGEGGLVWGKWRGGPTGYTGVSHELVDTERGVGNYLRANTTGAQANSSTILTAFNSNGFSIGTGAWNLNNEDFASWTFRKAEKFFDVVTFSGNSVAGREIAHNLGATPAFMIVKGTSDATAWWIYHASTGATKFLEFSNQPPTTDSASWNNTAPTDSVFTVGSDNSVNGSGRTYVAYLFASDAGGFGDDEDENIIKCGSYTGNGTIGHEINVGFEPQWVLQKLTSTTGNWGIQDQMRGLTGQGSGVLRPNSADAELIDNGYYVGNMQATATGFSLDTDDQGGGNGNGDTYIYMAIRRPMKTPTAGTEVYNPAAFTGSSSARTVAFNNPIDTAIIDWRSGSNEEGANFVAHRLLGKYFGINNTAAAVTNDYFKLDNSNGVYYPATTYNRTGNNYVNWGLTRAKGFYDVIIGGGNSVTSEVLNHNLGVTPELVLIAGTEIYANKSTSINLAQWVGWGGDYNYGANSGFISAWNSTQITTQQYISNTTTPQSIMLFATLAGVSKVGSFSGNGSSQTIDCGFTTGARFVMLKRTDAGSNQGVTTSNWYIWDSARGISAGNDPYLTNSLSSNFAENNTTDSIDPHSSGFILNQNATTDVNKSGASYIFLAIA